MTRYGRLRCERVVVYTHLGEDADGCARWKAVGLDGVAAFRRGGVKAGAADDLAEVYLFGDVLKKGPVRYVPPGVFDAMEDAAREKAWTLREDGRDRMAIGVAADTGRMPDGGAGFMRVVSVKVCDKGGRRMRHLRVGCR